MTTAAEQIVALNHTHIKLQADPRGEDAACHRPNLSVWADADDDGGHVVLMIDSMWGEHTRFVELTPDKARKLARTLLQYAKHIKTIVAAHAEPPSDLHCSAPFPSP